MYLCKGEERKGRGRPQKHDGKIDFKSLKNEHFDLLETSEIE